MLPSHHPQRYHPYQHYGIPAYYHPLNMPYTPRSGASPRSAILTSFPPPSPPSPSISQQLDTRSHRQSQEQPSSSSSSSQLPTTPGTAPVDSYRPLAQPSLSTRQSLSSPPRKAVDVYQERKKPEKTTAGYKILAELADITGQLSTLQNDLTFIKAENSALTADLSSLKNDNRHLRDQLHELQLGQRSLATREEVVEEMSQQLSTAFNEQLQSMSDKLDQATNPLAKERENSSSSGVSDSRASDSTQSTLVNLMGHLISKLDRIDDLSDTLKSLDDLPSSVTKFKQYVNHLDSRTLGCPLRPIVPPMPMPDKTTACTAQIDELSEQVTAISPSSSSSLDTVSDAIRGLETKCQSMKSSWEALKSFDSRLTEVQKVVLAVQRGNAPIAPSKGYRDVHYPQNNDSHPNKEIETDRQQKQSQPVVPGSEQASASHEEVTKVTVRSPTNPKPTFDVPVVPESIGIDPSTKCADVSGSILTASALGDMIASRLSSIPDINTDGAPQEATQIDSLTSITSNSDVSFEQPSKKRRIKNAPRPEDRPVTRSMSNSRSSKSFRNGAGTSKENAIDIGNSSNSSSSSDGEPVLANIVQHSHQSSHIDMTTISPSQCDRSIDKAQSCNTSKTGHSSQQVRSYLSTSLSSSQSNMRTYGPHRDAKETSTGRELARRLELKRNLPHQRNSSLSGLPRNGSTKGAKRFISVDYTSDEDIDGVNGSHGSLFSTF